MAGLHTRHEVSQSWLADRHQRARLELPVRAVQQRLPDEVHDDVPGAGPGTVKRAGLQNGSIIIVSGKISYVYLVFDLAVVEVERLPGLDEGVVQQEAFTSPRQLRLAVVAGGRGQVPQSALPATCHAPSPHQRHAAHLIHKSYFSLQSLQTPVPRPAHLGVVLVDPLRCGAVGLVSRGQALGPDHELVVHRDRAVGAQIGL